MVTKPKMNFYGTTPLSKPILAYRMAVRALQDATDRGSVIEDLLARLEGKEAGFRKFRFFLPDLLKRHLTADEAAQADARLAPRRARAAQLKLVYPDAADEFSLDQDFLAAVLDVDHGPALEGDVRYFTMGSCFAVNIATYLIAAGHTAAAFPLAEDLNSPLSNAFILNLLAKSPDESLAEMTRWVQRSFPEASPGDAARVAALKVRKVDELAASLAQADCVVLTLGNVVDFFVEGCDPTLPVMDKIFPIYVAMPNSGEDAASENDDSRAKAVALLKRQGASLRFATSEETREALRICVAGLRAVTDAPVVITVSPVPLSNAMSVGGMSATSAIEADCISKSRLRSALDDVLPDLQARHGGVFYFPAFEIVRWIGPTLPAQVFGRDDGGARHPSSATIEAVCALFVDRFVRRKTPLEAASGS